MSVVVEEQISVIKMRHFVSLVPCQCQCQSASEKAWSSMFQSQQFPLLQMPEPLIMTAVLRISCSPLWWQPAVCMAGGLGRRWSSSLSNRSAAIAVFLFSLETNKKSCARQFWDLLEACQERTLILEVWVACVVNTVCQGPTDTPRCAPRNFFADDFRLNLESAMPA